MHMAQLMPLPLTVSCFSKIQTGFTFPVPADPGSPEKRAVKGVCVCVNRRYPTCSHKLVVRLHNAQDVADQTITLLHTSTTQYRL